MPSLADLEQRVSALERRIAELSGAPEPSPGPAPAPDAEHGLVIAADGVRRYYRHGVLHRADGPAVIWPDGRRAWWVDGVLQRVDEPPAAAAAAAPPVAAAAAPRTGPAARPFDWSGLTAGVTQAQALAWAGAAVTLLGILFFFVLAAQHGWFTPPLRLAVGTAVSASLLGAGIRIERREGRFEAAFAAAAAGVAGLYTTLLAATTLYHYVDRPVALALAGGIAGIAVAVALVISAESLAGFGIVTAMLAPVAVQGEITTTGCAFVAVMLAGAVALHVRRDWHRMLLACVAASGPQVVLLPLAHVDTAYRGGPSLLALASVFAALYLAAAFVHGLRGGRTALDSTTITPVLMAASVVTMAVIRGLNGDVAAGISTEGAGFLLAAAAFGLAGLLPAAAGRRFADLSDLLWAIALGYAAAGTGEIASGQSVAIAWAAEGAGLAVAARRVGKDRLYAPAVAYLGLATADTLAVQAPAGVLARHGAGLHQGIAAAVAVAAGIAVLWWTLRGRRGQEAAAWAALAMGGYAAAEMLQGQWLVLAWAGAAAALVVAGDRLRRLDAHLHAAAFLAVAGLDAVAAQAEPERLLAHGVGSFSSAGWESVLAVTAGAAGLAVALRFGRARDDRGADAALAAAVGLGAYLTAGVLAGQWLVAAWAAEAALLGLAGSRTGWRALTLAGGAVWAAAAVDAVAVQSQPDRLFRAGPHPATGLPSVAAAAAAAGVLAWSARRTPGFALAAWAAVAGLVYTVSVAVLGAAEALPSTGGSPAAIRGAFQNGHTAVSALWALSGLGALYAGLRRGSSRVRAGGFVLLAGVLAKIFLYDLANLSSLTRAASFVAVGTALLAGALFLQRFAPRLVQPRS